ncbi:MAG: methionyl-tRNA formyltransferase [Candidatus Paceibacterota bacterium]|jgi:methionyl-tRNA formyltransferase
MINFAFFGSSRFSIIVLDELEKAHMLPKCIVTTKDKPVGRKQILTPNVTKQWGVERNIKVFDSSPKELGPELANLNVDVFIVASYGRILPKSLLDIPKKQTLNIHPSLLPEYRGPSPLPTMMIDDVKETGVSIMVLDSEMDHGPIVAQKNVIVTEWPTYEKFEEMMAREGARLLVEILPKWMDGSVTALPQKHEYATYTKKVTKEDGLIDLSANPYTNFRKIQAYHSWPQAYFIYKRDGRSIRVKIIEASYKNDKLIIEKVLPEGAKIMSFADFQNGYGITLPS